jgi:hypothetical protein
MFTTISRSGIGVAAESHRIAEKMRARLQQYRTEDLEAGFQASLRRKQQCRQLAADIRISEKAIMELDERSDVERHNLWPEDKTIVVDEGGSSVVADINTTWYAGCRDQYQNEFVVISISIIIVVDVDVDVDVVEFVM